MTGYTPVYRSPIHDASPVATPRFSLRDLSGVRVILIQGAADELLQRTFGSLPDRPNQMVSAGDGLLARLTVTQFYLFGLSPASNLPSATMLDAHFREAQLFAHATDYSDGIAVLRLVGSAAPELLSKICGLDFHSDRFPNLHVAQTSAAKIKTLIARYDEEHTPGYYLHVDAPSGQYFWETVLDAGQEYTNDER
jgi:heterotetrameric sarcosine oxidase gamma subunit